MFNSRGQVVIKESDDPTDISCQVKIDIDSDRVVEIRFGGRNSKLKLSEKQRSLLSRINDTLWTEPISQLEWMTASLGMVEDHDLVLQHFDWRTPRCPYSTMPFVVPEGDERTLLRMEDNIWIGVNVSTIRKVPFLEAFCSERWISGNEIPVVTSVSPGTLRLIDFVLSSGRDFLSTPLTRLPLEDFMTNAAELEEKLDFLNIPFKAVNVEGLDVMATCRRIRAGKYDRDSGEEAADLFIRAFEEGEVEYEQLDHKAKNAVFEAMFFVVSHPRSFGANQRSSMKSLAEEDIVKLTEKQEQRFDAWTERIEDTFDDGNPCSWSDDEDDEDYGFFRYECADYDDFYSYDSD